MKSIQSVNSGSKLHTFNSLMHACMYFSRADALSSVLELIKVNMYRYLLLRWLCSVKKKKKKFFGLAISC